MHTKSPIDTERLMELITDDENRRLVLRAELTDRVMFYFMLSDAEKGRLAEFVGEPDSFHKFIRDDHNIMEAPNLAPTDEIWHAVLEHIRRTDPGRKVLPRLRRRR